MVNKEWGGILHRKENKAVILYSILVNLYVYNLNAYTGKISLYQIVSKQSQQ